MESPALHDEAKVSQASLFVWTDMGETLYWSTESYRQISKANIMWVVPQLEIATTAVSSDKK